MTTAARWVDIVKAGGMKYVVLTAKHGDEFAMWPTKFTKRNSVEMGPKRDIAGDLAKAKEQLLEAISRIKPPHLTQCPKQEYLPDAGRGRIGNCRETDSQWIGADHRLIHRPRGHSETSAELRGTSSPVGWRRHAV